MNTPPSCARPRAPRTHPLVLSRPSTTVPVRRHLARGYNGRTRSHDRSTTRSHAIHDERDPGRRSSASRPTCASSGFGCSSRWSPCSPSRSPSRPRSIYGLAWGFGARPWSCPTLAIVGAGGRARDAHRLARPARPRTGRAPRGGPAHPRGRLRPGPRRVPARHADRARQPPRLPGGDRAPVGDGAPARPAAGRSRSSTSTTSSGSTTPRGHAGRRPAPAPGGGDHRRPTCAAPTARSASAATSSRSSCPAPTRTAVSSSSGRLLAACLDGDADGARRRRAVSFSAGVSAIPGHAARPRLALRPGRRRAVLGQAPRPDVRRRSTTRSATTSPSASVRRPSCPPLVARVAATGALRAVFQPIYDLTTGAPRGFEGLVRPLPDSGFADPGVDVRGRRGDRPDGRARPRLPQHGHGAAVARCACPAR